MPRPTRRSAKAAEEAESKEQEEAPVSPSKKSVAPKKAIKAKEAAAEAAKEAESKKPEEEEEKPEAEKEEAAEPMEVDNKDEETNEEEAKKPEEEKTEESDEKKDEEPAKDDAAADPAKAEEKKVEEKLEPEEDAIWSPTDFDVLSGRGASVNSHGGNKKFRALCFARKPLFEAGNHAAKRRIATEIVDAVFNNGEARFLKRKSEKGPWFELTKEQAILKACQVMRDYKRPDRIAHREMMAANGQARKRSRQVESTPMLDIPIPEAPVEPIIENPFGVHDHDILCGRGAFVNGHVGNQRLRKLAQERKTAFDAGNYTDKRSLANEIVSIIKALDPPGRFLKKASKKPDDSAKEEGKDDEPKEPESEWEELNDEKAIHKACQVMRDIDRPDRKDREERRAKKKQKMMEKKAGLVETRKPEENSERRKKEDEEEVATTEDKQAAVTANDEKAAVEEAVAATEEALDKALDAAETKSKEEVAKAESESIEV